jgi:hypothetical protein
MPATGLLERRFVELELGEPMRSQRADRLAWSR